MNDNKLDTILDHLYGELEAEAEDSFLSEVSSSKSLTNRLNETRRLLTAYRLSPVMEFAEDSAREALAELRKSKTEVDNSTPDISEAAQKDPEPFLDSASNSQDKEKDLPKNCTEDGNSDRTSLAITPNADIPQTSESTLQAEVSNSAPARRTRKLGIPSIAAIVIIGAGLGILIFNNTTPTSPLPERTTPEIQLSLALNDQENSPSNNATASNTEPGSNKIIANIQEDPASNQAKKTEIAGILSQIDEISAAQEDEPKAPEEPIEQPDEVVLELDGSANTPEIVVNADITEPEITPIEDEIRELLPEFEDNEHLTDTEAKSLAANPSRSHIVQQHLSEIIDSKTSVNSELEKQKEDERLAEIEKQKETERLAKIEKQKEAARLAEIEKQKEAERLAEIEKQKEAERLAEIEKQKEAERLAEIEKQKETERLAEIEKQKETERLAEIEKQKEAARLAEIEKQKEAERLAEIEKQKEAARLAEIEKQKEAERLAEIEKQKEAARLAEIEKQKEAARLAEIKEQKEAERLAKIEKQKEAERLAEIEKQKEAERLAEIEKQKETERLAEIEKQKEAARLAEIEKQKEAERLAEIEKQKEAERLAEIEKQKEAERLAEIEKQKETERLAEIEKQKEAARLAEIEKQKEAERLSEIEKQKEAERLAEIEKQKEASKIKVIEPILLQEKDGINSIDTEPLMALNESESTPVAPRIRPATENSEKIQFESSDSASELIQKAEALYLQESYLQALFGVEEALLRSQSAEEEITALILKARIELQLKSFADMRTTISRLKALSPLEASALQVLLNASMNHTQLENRKEFQAAQPTSDNSITRTPDVTESPVATPQKTRDRNKRRNTFKPTTDTYYKRK